MRRVVALVRKVYSIPKQQASLPKKSGAKSEAAAPSPASQLPIKSLI